LRSCLFYIYINISIQKCQSLFESLLSRTKPPYLFSILYSPSPYSVILSTGVLRKYAGSIFLTQDCKKRELFTDKKNSLSFCIKSRNGVEGSYLFHKMLRQAQHDKQSLSVAVYCFRNSPCIFQHIVIQYFQARFLNGILYRRLCHPIPAPLVGKGGDCYMKYILKIIFLIIVFLLTFTIKVK